MISLALPVNRFLTLPMDNMILTCMLPDTDWSKSICKHSAPISCKPQPFLHLWPMADLQLNETDEEASQQVFQIFQNMPQLWLDKTLKLEDRPGPDKRQRREGPRASPSHAPDQPSNPQLVKALQVLTRLMVQMDKDMQLLKAEDTCIFFFNNKEPTGCLPLLLKTTETWYASTQKLMPLRQRLMQVMMNELLTRVQAIGNAKEDSDLLRTAQKNNLILADRSFPYLEWDHAKQSLMISRRSSISLKRMDQICVELLEILTDVEVVRL